jgi:polysaccharide chain length determinant protein (PEP-CTERM system associated)
MPPNFLEKLRLLIAEAFSHSTLVVSSFVIVSLSSLVIGLNWPEVYRSYATVFVEKENILGPLTSGVAVQTQPFDRARLARDIIYGRKIMNKVVEIMGLSSLDPVGKERLIESLKKRTEISEIGGDAGNLIKIEYQDSDPDRTLLVTQSLASLFISESLSKELEESKSAYEFINKQVEQYKANLKHSEDELTEFREKNADISPDLENTVIKRIDDLRARLETLHQDLREASIRKTSLEKQLSGEAEVSTTLSKAGQHREKIAELQAKLDELLLTYYDTYPDVVRIRSQIEELRNVVSQEDRWRQEAKRRAKLTGKYPLDESVLANPLYQDLKTKLYSTNIELQTIQARIAQVKQILQENIKLAKRIKGATDHLAAITRTYEINKGLYQSFLQRRETARVSMQIDLEKKGLNLKIEEPAFLPHQPTGLRFWHFILGGAVLGMVMPFGFIFMWQQVDPGMRSESTITDELDIPILGTIQHVTTFKELWLRRVENMSLVLIILATFVLLGAAFFLRMYGLTPSWLHPSWLQVLLRTH